MVSNSILVVIYLGSLKHCTCLALLATVSHCFYIVCCIYPWQQVSAQAAVEETLKSWDIEATEKLLEGLEKVRSKRLEMEKKLKQTAENE